MHKRKYTREQLEFYFKKLMNKLKKIPREEDMDAATGFPSVNSYVDRFGSWQQAVELFANYELAKKKCAYCGKLFIKTKKTQKFCSDKCAKIKYQKRLTNYTKNIDQKIKAILGDKCFVCDFDKILEIHALDNKRESENKLLRAFTKKDMHSYVLLCPNHHQMLHSKLATLYYRNTELIWEE